MSGERIDVTFGAQIASLLTGLSEATAGVRESVEGMKGSLEGLAAAAETVMAPFILITALLEGGELFKEAIAATGEMGKALEIGSQKTGMAVEELSKLRYAADLSDVSAGELTLGLQRLARGMEQAEKGSGPAAAALKALAISVTDASGHLRPMGDVMLDIAERFYGMEDGAGKTALAMDLFGRSGANLIPLLNQGAGGIEALKARAEELGVVMGETDVEAANKYVDVMKDFHQVTEAAERSIAIGLMPALTDLGNIIVDTSNKMTAAEWAGKQLGSSLRDVFEAAAFVGYGLKMAFKDWTLSAVQKDWAAFMKLKEEIRGTVKALTSPLDKDPTLDKSLFGPKKPPPPLEKNDLLKQLEESWLAIKESERGNFGSLAQLELSFWQSKLHLAEAGSQDYLEIRKKIVGLEEQVARQSYEGELATLHAKEQADKDNLAAIVEDRQAELAIIRKHYSELSKEVQEGIARVTEAQSALQKETAKQWVDTFNAIPDAFSSAMKGIGKNVNSMRDLFRQFFLDLTKMSIESGLATLRNHVAVELAKKNVTAASVAERVALESWAAIQSVAKSAWAALVSIGNYAAEAIAATWASISAIPFVGPFMAPAMALGAGAAVIGLAGRVHSAAGGYDIPSGINPMTQLHAQEMVLPAELANRIRGMTGSGNETHVHLHVHAVDSRDAKRFLIENSDAVADAAARAVKNGRRSTRTT